MKTWINCFALVSTVLSNFAFADPVPRPVVPGLPPARPVNPGLPPIVQPPYGGLPPARPVNPGLPPIVQPPYGGLPPARPVNPGMPPIVQPPYAGLPPARPVYPGQPVLPPAMPVYPGQPVLPPARPVYPGQPVVVVPPIMPWPVYVPRPIYRPTPVYFPTPMPGSYRVLEGYAQPFNANNVNWYQEYGIQVIDRNNGYKEITLFPDMICSSYSGYCPGIDKTPITFWVSSINNDGCGGNTYYAYTNYSAMVRSIILTDNSRSFCGGNYQGLLQLVVNNANGTQELLIGSRSY